MQAFQGKLLQLRKSYRGKGVLDNSLINAFQRSFQDFRSTLMGSASWNQEDIPRLIDIIKGSYDASNDIHVFFRSRDYNLETSFEICLRIRMICSELLQILIGYLNTHEEILMLINYKTLYLIAFEILVLTTRMCLDVGVKHLSFAKKANDHTKLIITNAQIPETDPNIFIFCLNDLEIAHYEPQSKLNTEHIKEKLCALLRVPVPEYQVDYEEYIKWILMEVAVKLLKRGDSIEWLHSLLPSKELNTIKGIYSPQDFNYKEAANMTGVTTLYYQLYIQVRQNGFSKITEEKLRELLALAWNQRGFFEVLAENYSQCVDPLRIWFNCYNSHFKKETENSHFCSALKFFISVVQYQQSQDSPLVAASMVELVKEVLCSLTGTKKSMEIPVNPVLRSIVILIRQLVIIDHPNEEEMVSMFQTLRRLLETHCFPELSKDLAAIEMFYLLARNSPRVESSFREYLRVCPQHSQLRQIITIACESIIAEQLHKDAVDLIKRQPAFSYLFFRSRGIKTLLLADSDSLDQFEDIFGIFAQVLIQQYDSHFVVERLLAYVGQTAIQYTQKTEQQLGYLVQILLQKSKAEDTGAQSVHQLVLCGFFCEVLKTARRLGLPQKSINHNKYYKTSLCLEQMLHHNHSHQLLCQVALSLLASAIPKLMIDLDNGKECLFQVGQFPFYQLLEKLLLSKNSSETNPSTVRLLMFQLRALNNQESQLIEEISRVSDFHTLNLYNSCSRLPDRVRIELVRKVIFLGVSSGNTCSIGINHLKTAILYCNDLSERVTYAKQMLFLYEEEGRKFLELMAEKFPQLKGVFRDT